MKKIYWLIFWLSFSLCSYSQQTTNENFKGKNKNNLEERAEKISNWWKKELNLSENERLAFKAAKLEQLNKKKMILSEKNRDRKKQGEDLKKINQEFRNKIKEAWGNEKYELWMRKKQEYKSRARETKQKKSSDIDNDVLQELEETVE